MNSPKWESYAEQFTALQFNVNEYHLIARNSNINLTVPSSSVHILIPNKLKAYKFSYIFYQFTAPEISLNEMLYLQYKNVFYYANFEWLVSSAFNGFEL